MSDESSAADDDTAFLPDDEFETLPDDESGEEVEESEESGEESGEESSPKKSGIQKRFHEYSQKVREQASTIAELRADIQAAKSAAPVASAKEPNPDDFEHGIFDPKFQKAHFQFMQQDERAEFEQRRAEQREAIRMEEAYNRLKASEKAYAKNDAYALAKDTLISTPVFSRSEILGDLLQESENPAALILALGSNPGKVAKALAKKSAAAQLLALAPIIAESALKGGQVLKATPKSGVPARASRNSWDNTENLSQKAFEKLRERET